MNKPRPVAPALAERVRAATIAKVDADETAAVMRRRWAELIVEAVDVEGCGTADVAALAGVTRSRITAVIEHYYRTAS